jgi:ABC-2 type transport system permease protein
VNKDSVLTLAQKEFSDKLYEPSFIILLAIFTSIMFEYLQNRAGGDNFGNVVQVIAVFFPF